MKSNYAKAFRIIRAAFGLKQAELAERMPITSSHLSLIEAGKRQPSVEAIDGLAKAVGVPAALISLLATESEEMEKKADADISDLAKALLRLLVSAKENPQQSLNLDGFAK